MDIQDDEMGEAKKRVEEMRAAMIAELDKLAVPATPEEAALNDEIRDLKFYECSRVPANQLAFMGMEPQRCHLNVGAYVKMDPKGTSWHQGGWWKRNGIFYFHSMVLTEEGKLRCVTPHPDPSTLQFAPDDDIVWDDIIDGARHPRRKGLKVPTLVRDEPEKVIAEATATREKLIAGADPMTITFRF